MTDPHFDKPSREVAAPGAAASLPSAANSYSRLPTGPVPMEQHQSGPDADTYSIREWEPTDGSETVPRDDARLAPWALFAAIVALATSMFVGWGIPVAVVSVMAAIMSLRRPVENRSVAIWALVLGLFATLFSTGWLIWATMQFGTMG